MFLGYIFLLVYQYFTTKNTTYKLVEQQINDYTQQEKKKVLLFSIKRLLLLKILLIQLVPPGVEQTIKL
jgi:hypothetical protein